MKRNLKSILFLLCAIVLMIGGAMLYQRLSAKGPETPAPVTVSEDPAPDESAVVDVYSDIDAEVRER